ncbi:hypothetical protein D3C71_2039140 [compost metagenome]
MGGAAYRSRDCRTVPADLFRQAVVQQPGGNRRPLRFGQGLQHHIGQLRPGRIDAWQDCDQERRQDG